MYIFEITKRNCLFFVANFVALVEKESREVEPWISYSFMVFNVTQEFSLIILIR